jgi:hypothetical protein
MKAKSAALTNDTLREAVRLWLGDRPVATTRYGRIGDWDTSDVTDMSRSSPFSHVAILISRGLEKAYLVPLQAFGGPERLQRRHQQLGRIQG